MDFSFKKFKKNYDLMRIRKAAQNERQVISIEDIKEALEKEGLGDLRIFSAHQDYFSLPAKLWSKFAGWYYRNGEKIKAMTNLDQSNCTLAFAVYAMTDLNCNGVGVLFSNNGDHHYALVFCTIPEQQGLFVAVFDPESKRLQTLNSYRDKIREKSVSSIQLL